MEALMKKERHNETQWVLVLCFPCFTNNSIVGTMLEKIIILLMETAQNFYY
jgi:hypothetical protein